MKQYITKHNFKGLANRTTAMHNNTPPFYITSVVDTAFPCSLHVNSIQIELSVASLRHKCMFR